MFFKPTGILLLFFLSITNVINAQEATIKGKVTDAKSNEALPGVTVFISPTNAINTDINGEYILQSEAGKISVVAKFIGYETKEKKIEVKTGENILLNFQLKISSTELSTIVVSAGKFEQRLEEVTVSMEVLKSSLVENNNDVSLDESLQRVPGVTIIEGQANIRGGSGFSYGAGSRVLVMVDDLPMLTADAGDVKWSFIPVEILEQVEIIKGASSALFGSSAMNGVINIRTAYAKSKPVTKFSLFSSFYEAPQNALYKWWGKNTQLMSGANFLHAQKFGKWDVVFGSQYLKDDGFREGESEERHRFNASLRHRFKNVEGLSAGIKANYMNSRGGVFFIWADDSTAALQPLGGLGAGTTLSNYNTIRYNIDPFLTYISNNGFSYKLRMRYFNTSNFNDTKQEAFANLYYGESVLQKTWAKYSLTVTGGGVLQNGEVMSDLYGTRENVNRSLYLQADKKFFDKVNVSVGARQEWYKFVYDKTESQPIIRAGANYEVVKGSNIRTSYGQGYRYPTIAEKYIRTHVSLIEVYPNDSIKSESGWSAEFGARQLFLVSDWKAYLDAVVFRSEYNDMLEFTFGRYGKPTDPFYGNGFKSVNIGNTRIDGFEISAGAEGKLFMFPISFIIGYTQIDPTQRDFDSTKTGLNSSKENILKYRYKKIFKADFDIAYKFMSIGIGSRYNSFMENIDETFNFFIPGVMHYREEHDKGDWVYDARIAYKIDEHVKASFICKNIFNHEYVGRPADMQPTRSFIFQLSCSF